MSEVGIFFGFTVTDIQRWLGVSRATAYRYRTGQQLPPRAAVRLLSLYQRHQVLGTEWRGWRVHGDSIICPAGYSFTPGKLNAYGFVHQLAVERFGYDGLRRILEHAESGAVKVSR